MGGGRIISGTNADDTLSGTGRSDIINGRGGDGNDLLVGGRGDDRLDGGGNDNRMLTKSADADGLTSIEISGARHVVGSSRRPAIGTFAELGRAS